MGEPAGRVMDVIRGSTHDGPGVRTVIFLQGCPLRCAWCQNPESQPVRPEVWREARRCIGCGACLEACRSGALTPEEAGLRREPAVCVRCGACVDACPSRAFSWTGRERPVADVVTEALRDRDYQRAFGGGVTLSGGEPLLQADFAAALFERLRAEGVHTALDTCGAVPAAAFDAVLPHTALVLYDLKLLDSGLHRQWTGLGNEAILANLIRVAERVRASAGGLRLWIRTPLIPGATATPENMAALGRFICERLAGAVERWELCAFNGACAGKYERLGREWPFAGKPLMPRSEVEACRQAALSSGFPEARLEVSGLAAGS